VGLSGRAVVWIAVSQTIVFLNLMDEETSLLVLVPTGIATVLEVWKVQKVIQIKVLLPNQECCYPQLSFYRRV
jgi:hypothetical protein